MESLLQQVQLLQMLGLHRSQGRGPGDLGTDPEDDFREYDSDAEKVGEVSQGAQARLTFGGHRGGRSRQGHQEQEGLRDIQREKPLLRTEEFYRPDSHDLLVARLEENGRLVAHTGVPRLPIFTAPVEAAREQFSARNPLHVADLRLINAQYHDRLAEFVGTEPTPASPLPRQDDLDRRLFFLERYYEILEQLGGPLCEVPRPTAPDAPVPEKVKASSGARLMARQRRHLWSSVLTPDPPAAPALPETAARVRPGTRGGLRRRLKSASSTSPSPRVALPPPSSNRIPHRKIRQGGRP